MVQRGAERGSTPVGDGKADGVAEPRELDGAIGRRRTGAAGRPPAQEPRSDAPAGPRPAGQPQPAPLRMPERPKLAPGVALAGQMRESAFVDPPWLLEREEAGYIQVTELLYRVAEQCDGQQTFDQIAQKVSEAINRNVSAENVQVLIAKQLLPKGLVADADGRVAAVAGGARSPLALNMKMAMLSPAIVNPLVTVLKLLFLPPILVGLLGVAVFAEVWLYVIHGISGSLRDALFQPGLMLAVLGVIVFSAAFHELGHGAAIEYGGGKLKGMGAGIYLVYPAFYTDVSDNYRLGRWGRVRTDLGGFYFNLIFALGMLGLYLLTGREFLLLVIALINLEIIHQLLPFVRLDGYWTLADLTGVPDFFSQMGAYLRSVLPFAKLEGRKLPELKGWAKAAFGLYMLVTLPLLAFVLFGMIRGLPRIMATAWESFQQQLGAFGQAQASGQVLGMAAAAIQMLVLALPTLGICFTLSSLGRRLAALVWNWSKPTPTRRLVGSLGTLGAIGLMAYLWAPQLPFGTGEPGPLYRYQQQNFRPLSPEERGTVFEVVGAPQPAWLPAEPARQPEPTATVAPTSEASPAPIEATAQPTAAEAPTEVPTAASTTAPTAATVQPTPLPPTVAPRAPAGAPPPAPAAPTPAATVGPTEAPMVAPTAAATPAPTAGSARTAVATAGPPGGLVRPTGPTATPTRAP